jgi:DNA-nicking Smr family endonuclease
VGKKNTKNPFFQKLPEKSAPKDPAQEDALLWERFAAGVQPLPNRDAYAPLPVAPDVSHPVIPQQEKLQKKTSEPKSAVVLSFVWDGDHVYGAVSGVSKRMVASLAAGDGTAHQHLDLHGFTLQEACEAVTHWVPFMRHKGERCVLIVTGKGKSSVHQVGVIKQHLPEWLSQPPLVQHVLAFTTASPKDGGTGAFYVMLRRK